MYTNILIATDGSDLAKKGVDHGLSLAEKIGAKVVAVTVSGPLPLRDIPPEGPPYRGNPFDTYRQQREDIAADILNAAEVQASARGVACEKVHVADMDAADGILATAKEKGCNLIVMTSHGRRGLGRLLLGSQTVDVLTHSDIPVLVVK